MVYVLDINGVPMMPTRRHGKVRRMLKDGRATLINRKPLTIQLNYEHEDPKVQHITLGIDYRRDVVSMSAQADKRELLALELVPRQDVEVVRRKTRELRQARRRRKANRKAHPILKGNHAKTKQNGFARVNIGNKVRIDECLNIIDKVVTQMLPIKYIRFEVSEIQRDTERVSLKDKSPKIPKGVFVDVVEKYYARHEVLNRDKHTCQWCNGRNSDKTKILTVKHLDNEDYATLCKICRVRYDKIEEQHLNNPNDSDAANDLIRVKNTIYSNLITNQKNQDENFSNPIVKIAIYNSLKSRYEDESGEGIVVQAAFGRRTNLMRFVLGIENTPINNARIIANRSPYEAVGRIVPGDWYDRNEPAKDRFNTTKMLNHYFYYRFRKHHDRSLHKVTPKKGGIRPPRGPKIVKGFSSYDEVRYIGSKHKEYYGKTFFITKKRKTGYFGLGDADGNTIINSVKFDSIELVRRGRQLSVEVRHL
jgi:hypothetical protein